VIGGTASQGPMTDDSHLTTGNLQVIPVAAGILVRDERILICQRHRSDRYGLQWEFPGGKVGGDETREQALRRELNEELGVQSEIGPEVYRVRHRYPDRYVEVVFFRVDSFVAEPRNLVFEAIAWARRDELTAYRFLDADRDLVERIARGEIA
jgi:mutator protein MutT